MQRVNTITDLWGRCVLDLHLTTHAFKLPCSPLCSGRGQRQLLQGLLIHSHVRSLRNHCGKSSGLAIDSPTDVDLQQWKETRDQRQTSDLDRFKSTTVLRSVGNLGKSFGDEL